MWMETHTTKMNKTITKEQLEFVRDKILVQIRNTMVRYSSRFALRTIIINNKRITIRLDEQELDNLMLSFDNHMWHIDSIIYDEITHLIEGNWKFKDKLQEKEQKIQELKKTIQDYSQTVHELILKQKELVKLNK